MTILRMNSNGMASTPSVAVIGCGYWGKNLVRNFHELGALGAISDPVPDTSTRIVDAYGCRSLSVDECLGDDSLRGIVISAPAAEHYALAKAALLAGKDVFVEKPLALDVAHARELCEIAASRSSVLMVGHLLQYHPAFLKLRDIVVSGTLGDVQYLYSNRLNLGKFRREENILWSFAPHDLSMILDLVGEDPSTVSAVGGSYLNKPVVDTTTTHLTFPGGIRAHVFVSWLHPFKEQKLVVVGTAGMAVFDDNEPWSTKLALYEHEIDWEDGSLQPVKAAADYPVLEEAEPLKLECKHFLECIDGRQMPRTDGLEGLRVLKVLHQAETAMSEVGP